jgi:acyl-CoA reductase-like NAD-dependent aldehyde dehydrogenase
MLTKVKPAVQLKDMSLFRQQCYIDGQWVDADDKSTLAVYNPADGQQIGTVPKMGEAETRRAIETAHEAMKEWRARTAKDRSAVLRKWFDLMMANQEDLAVLMTVEQGKPLAESRGEIAYGSSSGSRKRRSGSTATPFPRRAPTAASSSSSSRSACARRSPRGISRTR